MSEIPIGIHKALLDYLDLITIWVKYMFPFNDVEISIDKIQGLFKISFKKRFLLHRYSFVINKLC